MQTYNQARHAASPDNLAIAYSDRICGERERNLELALECYQQALQVYTILVAN